MDFPYKTADVTRKDLDTLADGTPVNIWYLVNRHGMRAEVFDLAGIVNRITVIGGDLKKHNVALGAREIPDYVEGPFIPAALRTAMPGPLPVMEAAEEGRHVVMRHTYEDGPYAGITEEIRFAVTESNEFVIGRSFSLAGDAPAAVALPPILPIYFNLAGQEPGNALDHAVAVDAVGYLDLAAGEGDEVAVSTPEEARELFHDVAGTPADYRMGKTLAEDILLPECLGGAVAGFDYALLLGDAETDEAADGSDEEDAPAPRTDGLVSFATLYCARSRIYLDLATDAAAVRLTTFQPPEGVPVEGMSRSPYGNHAGIAIDPMPLPGTLLGPGEEISFTMAYCFTTDYPEDYYTDSGSLNAIL